MLKYFIVVFALSLALLFSGHTQASDTPKAEGTQTQCPILAGKINKNIYTDYQGKRIYFCCSECISDFKKNPDKYIKEMEDKGIQPDKTPAAK